MDSLSFLSFSFSLVSLSLSLSLPRHRFSVLFLHLRRGLALFSPQYELRQALGPLGQRGSGSDDDGGDKPLDFRSVVVAIEKTEDGLSAVKFAAENVLKGEVRQRAKHRERF